jgi:hypothetical protein
VVVEVGDTVVDPDVFTAPMLGAMLTEVAPVVTQINVELWPAVIVAGFA